MRAKLGLTESRPDDLALIEAILKLLAAGRVDYPIFWRRLSRLAAGGSPEPVRDLFIDRAGFDAWCAAWTARRSEEPQPGDAGTRMLATNPQFILRNHLGELAIRAAREGDFSRVRTLMQVLHTPFTDQPGHDADLAGFPPEWAHSIEISCSS